MRHVAAAVIVVLVVLPLGGCGGPRDIADIEDVQVVLADDDAFDMGKEAGVSFARIADGLVSLGRRCVERRSREDEQCRRSLGAAAYAQVFAVEALDCTQPGIDEARAGLARYLRDGGEIPAVPECN